MALNKIVVGAHYGLGNWLAQRVTAVVMTLYTFVLLGVLVFGPELSYGTWAALFSSVWIKVLTVLALLSLSYHTWLGMRSIFMDYIKPTGVRFALHAATLFALLGYTIWAMIILWSV